MSLKVAQVSDIHIRNLKYHSEYRKVFENLYRHLDELKPDIVMNTGDTAHTKTQISPEFVEMASEHLRRVAEYAPYHVLLGNHDLNLMNADRQDAISPIVESIKSDRIYLHKKSGLAFTEKKDGQKYNFWAFSLADRDNYPLPSAWAEYPEDVNIGLFHGSVATCVTDTNWRMTVVEHDLSIFDGLDFAMLGDIHKQQFFRNRTIAYPGSLVQQNFGEEVDKGFLLWELGLKHEPHSVSPYILKGSRKFHTIRLNDDLSIPDLPIEEGSRVRVSPPTALTLVQQKEIENLVRKQYKPYDVITLSAVNIGTQKTMAGAKSIDIENLRSLPVQEKLIRDFLLHKKLDDDIMQKILDLNRKYQIHVEQEDDTTRNVKWKLNRLVWSNYFNYGGKNVLDMSMLPGLTGIFAPNGSGKSNLIDVILETCFDSTTKGVSKNIHLINDNKDQATAIADITVNDENFLIERTIDRVKYGQRKFEEAKEWGKTTVNFSMVDNLGGIEPLVGTLRPETEKNIRQRIGNFDDFMLTSLSAQWNPMDIIANKETKRKEIFYKFFDLDLFEQKGFLAKAEAKEFSTKLADLESSGIEDAIKRNEFEIEILTAQIDEVKVDISQHEEGVRLLDEDILSMTCQKIPVESTLFDVSSWAGTIKHADNQVGTNRVKLDEIEGRLSVVEADLAKVCKLEKVFDLSEYELKADRCANVALEIANLKGQLIEKKRTLTDHVKASANLTTVPCGDKYPGCRFIKNAFESKNAIDGCEVKISEIDSMIVNLQNEYDDNFPFKEKLELYRKFVGEKQSLESSRDNLRLQMENIRLKIDGLIAQKTKLLDDKTRFERIETDVLANNKIDSKISETKGLKRAQIEMLQEYQEQVVSISRTLGGHQSMLDKLKPRLAEIKDLRDTCTAYEHYIEAMGKDGIAYNILTQKLPLLNDEINKILSNCADFTVSIEHDNEEQSIRFFIQYGQYKRRLLELGSGAEKFLASLAIRTSLLNVSNLPKTNMFIIDEGFGKLDTKNLESVQRMFDYLRTVFDHIIVISHLDSMKDMVDNIIEFTADDEGYAHINIGG